MIEINNLKKGDTAYFLVPASNEIAHGVILDYQITNNEATVALKCSHYPYFGMHSETNTDLYESEHAIHEHLIRKFSEKILSVLDNLEHINMQSNNNPEINSICHNISDELNEALSYVKHSVNDASLKSTCDALCCSINDFKKRIS